MPSQAGCDLRRTALDVLRPLPTPHTLRVTTDISWHAGQVSETRRERARRPDIDHYKGTTVRSRPRHADSFDQHPADRDAGTVCAWTTGASTLVVGRFQNFYDPNTWQCWV